MDPADEILLALVREGRMDAEIAVRLGITNADVKVRIERLCSLLGAEDRAALRGGRFAAPPDVRAEPAAAAGELRASRPWFAGVTGLVVGVGATLLVLFALDAGDSPNQAAFVGPGPTSASASAAPATSTPTVTPARATPASTPAGGSALPGTLVDAGQLFSVAGNYFDPVVSVSSRQLFSVVELSGPGLVRFDTDVVQWRIDGSITGPGLYLLTSVQGGQIAMQILPDVSRAGGADQTGVITGAADSAALYSTGAAGHPRVLLLVRDARTNNPVRSFVDERGHLFLYPTDDLPADVPADDYTGDRLDVSGAVRVGSLGKPTRALTRCDGVEGGSPAPCRAVWVGDGDVLAPVAGGVRCTASGKFEFDTDSGIRLFFAANQYTSSYCEPGPLVPVGKGGRAFPAGQYAISAQDSLGHALSVAVSADGTLYVGDFAPVDGCPCLGGN